MAVGCDEAESIGLDYVWEDGCAVFVDAVGYSSRVETAPIETRRRISVHLESLERCVTENGGQVVDTAGDGVFAEFPQPCAALECLTRFLNSVKTANAGLAIESRMRFRCGVSYGQVLRGMRKISGPKVNIAARLQQTAEPGTINIDDDAHQAIGETEHFACVDMGFRVLKGISNPVRIWRVSTPADEVPVPSKAVVAEYGDQRGASPERGIAVLPFEVPPGKDLAKEEDAWMALGMAGDIAEGLARSHWLKVISPRSSMNYSDPSYDDKRIAQELGVRYLLRGRIRTAGPNTRISVALIDSPTEHTVWSANFDRNEKNLFDIQDEITRLIVGNIEPEFLRHEAWKAAHSRPRNLDSWELLMRARWHFWRGTKRHMAQAMESAEKALQLEPGSARVYTLLSFCHMMQVWIGMGDDPEAMQAEALRLARQAVKLDDYDPNAHYTLGTALSMRGDLRDAIAAEKRAIELNPNFAAAYGELGRMCVFSGKPEEARRHAALALELSPSDPHTSLFIRSMALAALTEGNFEAARDLSVEASAKRPDWFFHHALTAACEALMGDVDRARQTFAETQRLLPDYKMSAFLAGHPFSDDRHRQAFISGLKLAGWEPPDELNL